MMVTEGVTEELKEVNQMEWVQKMSEVRNRVKEAVLSEIVYE